MYYKHYILTVMGAARILPTYSQLILESDQKQKRGVWETLPHYYLRRQHTQAWEG